MAYVQILVAALLVISAPWTEGRGRDSARRFCHRSAGACMELHLDEYVGIRGQSAVQQALSNRTLVTEMAADWAKASACVEKVLDLSRCQGTGDRFGPIILFSGFINSPGAIDKIVAMSSSQCLTEENALDETIDVLQQCVTTFDQAVSEKTRRFVCKPRSAVAVHGGKRIPIVRGSSGKFDRQLEGVCRKFSKRPSHVGGDCRRV